MLRLQLLVCIAALALAAGTAQANPYSLQVLRTRALPGPHVQITYGVDASYVPMGSSVETPTLAAAFGTKQTPWVTTGYITNTGSGLVGLQAIQCCDCFVPKGAPLTYQATVKNVYPGATIGTVTLISTITVSDSFDAATPVDSGPIGDGGGIPDPVQVQGVDCTSVCLAFTPDASIATADVPIAASDATIVVPDASPTSTDATTVAFDAPVTTVDTPIVVVDVPTATPDAPTATPDSRIAAFDASAAIADAPIAVVPDAKTTTVSSSKGCSYGETGHLSGLSLVAVLGLLFFRRHRRGS